MSTTAGLRAVSRTRWARRAASTEARGGVRAHGKRATEGRPTAPPPPALPAPVAPTCYPRRVSTERARAEAAAWNNAAFCDLMCAAHGRAGTFSESIWSTRVQAPPYYPNAVTLAGLERSVEQMAHIRALCHDGPRRPWAVKDSHAALRLEPLGFETMFTATWIWRAPAATGDPTPLAGWEPVRDETGLAAWERAWRGTSTVGAERLFLPALLGRDDLCILAAWRGLEIVAGAIACRAAGVVGITNLFVAAGDAEAHWAPCASAVQAAFPGLPLVGYARGTALALAGRAGFEALSDLVVWRLDP